MQGVQRRAGLNEYAQVVLQLAVYVSLTEDRREMHLSPTESYSMHKNVHFS